jgi:hypothetical protein
MLNEVLSPVEPYPRIRTDFTRRNFHCAQVRASAPENYRLGRDAGGTIPFKR